MKLRRAGLGIALCATLLCLAGVAPAASQWLVTGTVDRVDDDRRLIEVSGQELYVTKRSVIKRGDSSSGDWEDVVDRDGEHVSVLVERGYRGDEAVTIVLDEVIED